MAQHYITSSTFSNLEIAMLSSLRSYTIREQKNNFSSWYKPNFMCPLSHQSRKEDSQPHMLRCKAPMAELTPDQQLVLTKFVNLSHQGFYILICLTAVQSLLVEAIMKLVQFQSKSLINKHMQPLVV